MATSKFQLALHACFYKLMANGEITGVLEGSPVLSQCQDFVKLKKKLFLI